MARGKINEIAQSTVLMNGKQAADEMKRLGNEADKFAKKKREAFEKNDHSAYKKWDQELKNVNKQMKNMRMETQSVEAVLKNINGASLLEIERAARKATMELKKMGQTDPGYKEKAKQAELLNTKYRDMNKQLRGVTETGKGFFDKMAYGFNKYFTMATGLIATATGIVFGFRQAINTFNEFEERLDNLSALTGLVGEDLDWLSKRAEELSVSMLENNIRVRQSATEIVDAFTKTGSARPELLKNREALAAGTAEAIILANAAKTQLEPAINALTMVMNQYNVPASEARRIINAIAAGSKEGAGEIPYITAAFEKAGTVAADADISIETLVATIETLAPRITAPEIAGRTLKGVLLDLQTTADDTNPAIVGLIPALENLAAKELSVVELTKLFGTENITTAKILLNNIGELKKYETAVTGTNVAIEQAAINTDNNNSKLDQAKNKMMLITKELGKNLAPAFTFSTNAVSYIVNGLVLLIRFMKDYGDILLITSATLAAYTVVVNAHNISLKAWYYWTMMVEKAQKLLNTTTKMNPYAAVAGLLAGMVTYLIMAARRTNEAAEAQKKYNKYLAESEELLNRTASLEERGATIDKMSKSQLERFVADTQAELEHFEKMEDKKLLAAQDYQNEVAKLEKYVTQNATTEEEKRALLNNKFVTEARDAAFTRLQEVSRFIDGNKQKLQSYLQTAQTALGMSGGGGDGLTEAERIAKYAEANKKAFEEWKQQNEFRLNLLKQLNGEEDKSIRWVDRKDMPEDPSIPEPEGLDFIQRMMDEQKLKLGQSRADGLIDQQQYNLALEDMEVAHLLTMLELRKQLGYDTMDIEQQLLEIRLRNQRNAAENQIEIQRKVMEQFADFATTGAQALEDYMSGNEDALKEGARAKINIALDMLKSQMQIAIAGATMQSLAQPDSVATLGATGWARAAILAGLIEMAFGAVKGLVNAGFEGYESGGYTGSHSRKKVVGVVHGQEFVGNADATTNSTIRPVFDLINYAQQNGTVSNLNLPAAMAASGMMSPANTSTTHNVSLDATMMLAAVARFEKVVQQLQEKGIEGRWVYQDFKKIATKESRAISKTK